MTPQPGLALDDLFRLRWLGRPQISPDGLLVALIETTLDPSRDRMSRRAVIRTSTPGDGPERPVSGADAAGIAWSPDGSSLAVAGEDGLWIHPASGGAGRRLAAAASDEPDWSPDGGRIAVCVKDGSHPYVQVHYIEQGVTRSVETSGRAAQPRWSPDGRSLGFLSEGRLWVTTSSLDGGRRGVPLPVEQALSFTWSPDGTRVAVLGRVDADLVDVGLSLWTVALGNGGNRRLNGPTDAALGSAVRGDDPRGTGPPALCWSPATGRIYVESVERGRGPLCWFAADGQRSGRLLDGEHACLEPAVSPAGLVAAVVTGPTSPGEIWIVDERSGESHQSTHAGAEVAQRALATRQIRISHEGEELDGWLTGGTEGWPALIVNVHGGPYYAVGWRFTFEVQRLAATGASVLTVNPRGSSGRGDAFAAANRGDWGGVDAGDIEAAVDGVVAKMGFDRERVALWGVSYGGFMTQWLLSRSRRFCTAVSENGISDFVRIWDEQPASRPLWTLALGGTPNTSILFDDRSPIRRAYDVLTPLLLVHAEEDESCPLSQSLHMYQVLRDLGASVELIRLPGEGHLVNLVGRPSSRLRRAGAVDRWLARTLYGADPDRHEGEVRR